MKKITLIILLFVPICIMAQGHKGQMEECAPMKKGKVCYVDEIAMEGVSKESLFDAINNWATQEYGRDVFVSNHVANKKRGTIFIRSKYDLLLDDVDSTQIKFRLDITCFDQKYTAELSDIVYVYDPEKTRKFKSYKAEDVIAGNGTNNKIAIIKDPLLFCNGTFFFAHNILADILNAANEAE